MVVSNGEEMHILFLLTKPVLENDKPVMMTQEQALITIPLDYAETLGNAILENHEKHVAQKDIADKKETVE
jgi:hypothetical protein